MYCYSNDGMSFRAVLPNYQAQFGEVLFSEYATSDQLISSFPNYSKLISNLAIKKQIDSLESQQTDRRIREAFAGTDNGWLDNLNSQISTLRVQLQS